MSEQSDQQAALVRLIQRALTAVKASLSVEQTETHVKLVSRHGATCCEVNVQFLAASKPAPGDPAAAFNAITEGTKCWHTFLDKGNYRSTYSGSRLGWALVIESHSQVCAPAPDANSAVGEPTFVQTDEAPESQADAYELKLARAIGEVRALQNELANEQASSGQVHEAQKRTIAELEEKLKIPPARALSEALQNDSSYAWSWHSNLAVCFIDAGGTHTQANKAAAQFMLNAFGVNVTSFSEWKALGFRNSNPQFRITKPGVYLTSEGKRVRVLDRVDGSWLARFSDEMRTFFVLADGVVPGETFFIQSYRGEL